MKNFGRKQREANTVESYRDYLARSPIKEHQDEAAKRIYQIENAEFLAEWEQIQENPEVANVTGFVGRCTDGKLLSKVLELVNEQIEKPSLLGLIGLGAKKRWKVVWQRYCKPN